MGPTCGCGALACPFGVSATAGIIVSVYGSGLRKYYWHRRRCDMVSRDWDYGVHTE